MARPSKATQQKRLRERAQKEKQAQKHAAREQRKEAKRDRVGQEGIGADPDLAGIVPGPQPPLFE